jgi:hypothetical protein
VPSAPPLSPDADRELTRVVAVLAAAGVFSPAAPDPTILREGVADAGEPVTADVVLAAAGEADWWHPAVDTTAYSANLAFHDSHVEQDAGSLRAQADDLLRLAGHTGVAVVIELAELAADGRVPTTLRIAGRVHTYDGAVKYLSTVLHVAVARLPHGPGRRLAWLWSDQGAWITALPDGGVERLNADLGPAAGDGWEWVDEQEPTAAGAVIAEPGP